MRLISRLVGLALLILAAFWFTTANANELVLIDLILFRVRASLPLVVFGSILAGMGISLVVGWRANRRANGLAGWSTASRAAPGEAPTPLIEERYDPFEPGPRDLEPQPREDVEPFHGG